MYAGDAASLFSISISRRCTATRSVLNQFLLIGVLFPLFATIYDSCRLLPHIFRWPLLLRYSAPAMRAMVSRQGRARRMLRLGQAQITPAPRENSAFLLDSYHLSLRCHAKISLRFIISGAVYWRRDFSPLFMHHPLVSRRACIALPTYAGPLFRVD